MLQRGKRLEEGFEVLEIALFTSRPRISKGKLLGNLVMSMVLPTAFLMVAILVRPLFYTNSPAQFKDGPI